MRRRLIVIGAAALITSGAWIAVETSGPTGEACAAPVATSFAGDILPIFRGYCFECRQPGGLGNSKSGLDLSSYEIVMQGTKYGAMVVPGDPEASNLVWLLEWRGAPETRMPLGHHKLSACERNTIRAWIMEGAKNN